jgi:DNA-binding SARP family transcriptional activator
MNMTLDMVAPLPTNPVQPTLPKHPTMALNPQQIALAPSTGQAASRVEVRLLGHPRIVCDGVRIESGLSAHTLLLFAILTIRKDEILQREEIAFTLWPDLSESDARAALRRHIYKLHQALPASSQPWLNCTAKTVSWAPRTETLVDVSDFELLSESPETVESAAALYRGDFAPCIDHEWAVTLRERLRKRAHRVFEQAADRRSAQGDDLGALHYFDELLAHDPWREDAVRRSMLLRYRLGDRAGALAQYRRFSERLRADFEVDPMPETAECLHSIANGIMPIVR